MMTSAALNSERINIGHGITDPIMYHPQVLANAVGTLRELTDGRAFVGLGTGQGEYGAKPTFHPARVDRVREAMQFIRAYTAGEDATLGKGTWHSEWMRQSPYAGEPVPIRLAVSGPRMCRLGGELADAVFSIGINPMVQGWRKEMVERGAEAAGRDPSKIDFWVRTQIYIAESKEAAFTELAPYAAACAQEFDTLLGRKSPESIDLANRIEREHPGLIDEFKQIIDLWDPDWNERIGGRQSQLVTQRCVDFFLASGTVEDVREQLEPLRELGIKGVSNVTFALYDMKGHDQEGGDRFDGSLRLMESASVSPELRLCQ
jgi:alkanesulfonate monooxygenase SsuD/methylene tetrahydromethanopterin reductase-like flavin-dependent oxidoreductase (luciferase family)